MSNSDLSTVLLDLLPTASTVGLADPDQPANQLVAGEIVLGIGLTSVAASELLSAAASAGVAAVVLRGPEQRKLTELAADSGVELHWLPAKGSWRVLHRRLAQQLNPPVVHGDDELAGLAQTIATLTGGLVTIEDTSARVLAYSRSSDEVDELRRLSILGRSGPPSYLALLREWGVYDRLAASEEVVEIAEHPESGIRRRLAVGVFAGKRQLGAIWVQQGASEFGPNARQALLGAARLTAIQLVGQGARPTRKTGGGLAALLSGQPKSSIDIGRDTARPCAIAVFALSQPATTDESAEDPAAHQLRLDELAAIATVHATAFRRNAITDQLRGRVYVLLPNLDSCELALGVLTGIIDAVRRHLDPAARAAIGSLVEDTDGAPRSARAADLALVATTEPVISFTASRPRLIVTAVEDCLAQQLELLDPRIKKLIDSDQAAARTLLGYLDAGSDVGRVASQLKIHPTTVRYRLRHAVQDLDIDLTVAEDRLATQLQLRCELHRRAKER